MGGALGEKGIEAAALGHIGERRAEAPVEGVAETEREAGAVDRALDDGGEVDVLQGGGADRDAAAARLVPREAVPVEQEDGCAAFGEEAGGGAAGGAGAGYDDIVDHGEEEEARLPDGWARRKDAEGRLEVISGSV